MIDGEESTHSHRDEKHVVEKGPHEVDLNLAEGCSTDADSIYHIVQRIFHQDYSSGVDCNV